MSHRLLVDAETAAADAATFQKFLFQHQYPSDCSRTIGMTTAKAYFYSLGIGLCIQAHGRYMPLASAAWREALLAE